jgi:hypothetical protein
MADEVPDGAERRMEDLLAKIKQLTAGKAGEELLNTGDQLAPLLRQAKAEIARFDRSQRKPGEKWEVVVDDNYHFMDEDERYTKGRYDTEEEAIAVAKRIVDEFLMSGDRTGSTADQLLSAYRMYGDDPRIPGSSFSAWGYAEQRCRKICAPKDEQ